MRKGMTIIAGLLGAYVLLTATAAAEEGQPKGVAMDGAALQEMFKGGALMETENMAHGVIGSTALMPGGQAFVHWLYPDYGFGGQDVGTWRIAGNELCLKWKSIRAGEEHCFEHFRVGDNEFEAWPKEHGTISNKYRIRKWRDA